MALQQRLDVRMDQKLVMTPQLQMAIKLLQMSTIDLQGFIDSELMENPFLAKDDGTTEEYAAESSEKSSATEDSYSALEDQSSLNESHDTGLDMSWDSMYDSGSAPVKSSVGGGDDDSSWEDTATSDMSLKEHLQQQLGMTTDDPVIRFLASFMIDEMDDSGYIRVNLEEAAEKMNVPFEKMAQALEMIQSFEPTGVGARDLGECLSLQLAYEKKLTPAAQVILSNLELLARHEFGKLSRMAKVSTDDIQTVAKLITTLNPKPGLLFGSDVSSAVIPDVVVLYGDDGWKAELNVEAMPKVLMTRDYSGMVDTAQKGDDKNYMNDRVNRAQWLIKSLEQRAKTIFKVANTIVKVQEDFFNYGVESLQPLTLKMVAEEVGVHESTVSRVTNGKYMQTPMGVFEMKYFFSAAINTTGGNISVAAESVKQIIKRLIDGEDARKPLSDEKLVKMLKVEGIDVARRTVAKYRESLGILSSSGRRIRL